MSNENLLYSHTPGVEWKNGFPIGNGRIGGMLCGALDCRMALNHEWLYRGEYTDREVRDVSPERLAELRKMIIDGKYHEAARLGNELLAGDGGLLDYRGSPRPPRVDPYQPAGDLFIESADDDVSDYFRRLEIDKALFSSGYTCGKKQVLRRCFASFCPDGAESGGGSICYEYSSTEPSSLRVRYSRAEDPHCVTKVTPDGNGFTVVGEFKGNSHFALRVSIRECDGEYCFRDGAIELNGVKRVVMYIGIGAGERSVDVLAEASRLPEESFDRLLEKHIAAYSERYGACNIDIDCEESRLTAGERMERVRKGESDAGLPLLWYNYAKYLLLSSSGSLPPTLQGIWNESVTPPWQCDFHFDVNIEMCYWFAEAAGLGECVGSLFEFCERMMDSAREAARRLYGCRGIVFPLQTDAHSRATPESYGWAVWIGAAPWAGMHFWERWEYSRDEKFLRERAYPFLKAIAEFYEDYLIEIDGVMQLVPSQSPENRFGGEEMPVSLCMSSAMDVQLCGLTLARASEAAGILGCDADRRAIWDELRSRLPKLGIGSRGQLLEWNEEFSEDEPEHRHYSHMIGLYPGDIITEKETPELFEAADVSLRRRLSYGGGHTGWSRSWTACLLARLNDAEGAWEHLNVLIKDFATDSLLDLHPPRIFQIDGNFGGAAAVGEMLLRSGRDCFTLLPALPEAWKRGGSVRGMRAKNGLELSFEWRGGAVTRLEIKAALAGRCSFKCPGAETLRVRSERRDCFDISAEDGIFSFDVLAGESFVLLPRA